MGAVGRFWTPAIEWYDVTGMAHGEFADFDEPGWGRIAAGLSLRPYGSHRTLASYEARMATAEDDSAQAFSRYWRLVRPFVRHVIQTTLQQLAREAPALAQHRPTR